MSLEDKYTAIDAYIDNTDWDEKQKEKRRVKYKDAQAQMLSNPPITVNDIYKTKDVVDFLDMQQEKCSPQIYYLLIKIKDLEERITKLENP